MYPSVAKALQIGDKNWIQNSEFSAQFKLVKYSYLILLRSPVAPGIACSSVLWLFLMTLLGFSGEFPPTAFPRPGLLLLAGGILAPRPHASRRQAEKAVVTLGGIIVLIIMRVSAVPRGRCLASGVWWLTRTCHNPLMSSLVTVNGQMKENHGQTRVWGAHYTYH